MCLKQVSEALLTEKQIIQEQLEHTDTVPDFSDIFNHKIEVTLYKHPLRTSEVFVDTLLNDTVTRSPVDYRFLIYTSSTVDNRGYAIITSQSIEDEKRVLYEILGIIIISFSVFVSDIDHYNIFSFTRFMGQLLQYPVRHSAV